MAKVPARRKSATPRGRPKAVHQFLIVLSGTDPLVWRRIQVPESYDEKLVAFTTLSLASCETRP